MQVCSLYVNFINYMFWNFHGNRTQYSLLGQSAASDEIKFNLLETNNISIIRMMWKGSALNFSCFHISLVTEMELVSETLDFISNLTWLAAWEDFIELYRLFVTCDIFFECFTFLYWTLYSFLEILNGNFPHCDTCPWIFLLIPIC